MESPLTILIGDAETQLSTLPSDSVHCVVTSPPYWGLRDYGVTGQIGLEKSFPDYLAKLLPVFTQIWRVLRPDGTLWVNMGDCYARNGGTTDNTRATRAREMGHLCDEQRRLTSVPTGLREKSLVGQPWRLAFALQDAGWILRQDLIWHKPNPMPESVRDRCTKAHEYLFLLTKSPRYFWDPAAMEEPCSGTAHDRGSGLFPKVTRASSGIRANASFSAAICRVMQTRNRRSVWTIPTQGYRGAHFATFPEALVRPCIAAGCPSGGLVLDPFGGSGTTAKVALALGRRALLIELNPAYAKLARERCHSVLPQAA